MRLSNSFFYTIREDVKDEETISGNLLVRSGMIKKSSAGVYMFMPMGYLVFSNIRSIVKKYMDEAGAQELVMPSLIPEEVYVSSGRRKAFGSSMFSLVDRANKNYVLGPTHEELFLNAASNKIKSYKDMPFNLYQFQNKFRDEARPRYGLIRTREFCMKDAYSFDADLEGLDKSYQKMFDAYKKIFDEMGMDYRIVRADTGVMGGLLSEEFQAITDIGEDVVVLCDKCDYASNIEVSEVVGHDMVKEEKKTMEKVSTPGYESVIDVANYLNISLDKVAKTMIVNVDDELVACVINGKRELNLVKVGKLLHGMDVEFATEEEVAKIVDAKFGSLGPVGINCKVIVDNEVLKMTNFVVGANSNGYHYINVNLSDFKYDMASDIVNVMEGDHCPKCGGTLYFKKGIEVGNTFKLGTKYSEALNLRYVDKDNTLKPVVMGSYGIGVARCMSAIVEQNNDEDGIIWPINIAPYKVSIVIINNKDEEQVNVANSLYDYFNKNNVSCLLDDRDERAGIKFKDMDLIGIPYRIVVGKKVNDGIVEVKDRKTKEIKEILVNDILNYFN